MKLVGSQDPSTVWSETIQSHLPNTLRPPTVKDAEGLSPRQGRRASRSLTYYAMALASGTRPDQIPLNSPNYHLSSKASSNNPQAKIGKSGVSAPRIDLEPLYITLKEAIAESWLEYKEALRLYILGCYSV